MHPGKSKIRSSLDIFFSTEDIYLPLTVGKNKEGVRFQEEGTWASDGTGVKPEERELFLVTSGRVRTMMNDHLSYRRHS